MSSPPSSASARSTNARELSGSVTSRLPSRREPERHAGSGCLERPRGRRADPARRAGDDHTLARQVGHSRREVNARLTTRGGGGRLGWGDAASRGERPAQSQAHDRVGGAAGVCSRSWPSRAAAGSGTSRRPSRHHGYVSYAFTLFLIVFVLAIPVAAYGFLIGAREGKIGRKSFKSRVISNIATLMFFGFLAFGVIYMKRHHNQLFHIDTSALDKSKNALKNRPHRTGAAKYEPQFEWAVFWIALAVARGRRRGDVHPLPAQQAAEGTRRRSRAERGRGSRSVDVERDRRPRGRAGFPPRRDRRVRADGGRARPARAAATAERDAARVSALASCSDSPTVPMPCAG